MGPTPLWRRCSTPCRRPTWRRRPLRRSRPTKRRAPARRGSCFRCRPRRQAPPERKESGRAEAGTARKLNPITLAVLPSGKQIAGRRSLPGRRASSGKTGHDGATPDLRRRLRRGVLTLPTAMGNDHDHHPHHDAPNSNPAPRSYGRAFAVGIVLNLAFVVVEVAYGLVAHSLALVADAGHNLGDVLGLGLSWGATALATLRPSKRRTFGFRRSTIIASVTNALILLFVTGGLTLESIHRLESPAPTAGKTMIVVAL